MVILHKQRFMTDYDNMIQILELLHTKLKDPLVINTEFIDYIKPLIYCIINWDIGLYMNLEKV